MPRSMRSAAWPRGIRARAGPAAVPAARPAVSWEGRRSGRTNGRPVVRVSTPFGIAAAEMPRLLSSPERHPPDLMSCGRRSPPTEPGMHCLGSPLFCVDGLNTGRRSSLVTFSWSRRLFRSKKRRSAECGAANSAQMGFLTGHWNVSSRCQFSTVEIAG
jgi:hypothetical protein